MLWLKLQNPFQFGDRAIILASAEVEHRLIILLWIGSIKSQPEPTRPPNRCKPLNSVTCELAPVVRPSPGNASRICVIPEGCPHLKKIASNSDRK